ncbi:lysophospholipid acyltransferase family protein [Marinomonas posidonica]|uniref:Phospholipid/glycerol acyltransferase n=1 Tax=Marinomonas posidonica (strain CECT 7376 / NCIMB 14433 / IVIA-Po-181) TaxID=491952 RepID=F6CTW0_MARPP|nr:lysophospholipid acyltransferase family protein [Marinomonas posidonica]AEF56329.1 phospholipid/glycerol acyltransferase [Marinomonas posidonica IVIA-Po-181]
MSLWESLRSWIGSAIFFVYYVLSTVLFGALAPLATLLLPKAFRQPVLNLHNKGLLFVFRVFCGVKIEFVGLENIDRQRAFVLVANHQSEWETYLLQVLMAPVSTVLKKELLSVPFFGWGLRMVQPIAIDRSQRTNALKQIISQGKERIEDGRSVLIFPEGTRIAPNQEQAFNKGAAMLATSAKAPILPVVHNAGYTWPGKRWRKFSGSIRVVVGPVIESEGKKTSELHDEMDVWMRAEMAKLPKGNEYVYND